MSLDRPSGGDGDPDRISRREDRPFPSAPADREAVPEPPRNTLSMEELRAVYDRAGTLAELQAEAKAYEEAQAREAGSSDSSGPGAQAPGSSAEGPAEAVGDGAVPEPSERDGSDRTGPGTRTSTDSPPSVQVHASSGTSEGTRVTEKVADADTPEATDKSAERVKELETELAEAKGELAETKSELAEEKSDRRKLTSVVADQADEIKRLRAQLAAKDAKPDQPAEVREPEEDNGAPSETLAEKARKTKVAEDEPRKRRGGLPSAEGVSLFGAVVGSGEAVGAVTHTLTTGEQGLIGAGVTLLGSGILYAKAKYAKHKENQSDRPET